MESFLIFVGEKGIRVTPNNDMQWSSDDQMYNCTASGEDGKIYRLYYHYVSGEEPGEYYPDDIEEVKKCTQLNI